jgi:hypothetical protein
MNQEIKAKWLEKLRSGNYPQAKGALYTREDEDGNEGYCCLGILCEVLVEDGLIRKDLSGEKAAYGTEEEFEEGYYEKAFPPQSVVDRADLLESNPEVSVPELAGEDGKVTLSSLNDSYGYTFARIADLIEKQL